MKRIISLMIIIMCVLCSVSCVKTETQKNNRGTTAPTEDINNIEQTTAPETPLIIAQNGVCEYKIVRPENSSEEIINATVKLRTQMLSKYHLAKMMIGTDFESPNQDPAQRYKYEILVGNTNRPESAEALRKLNYNDYIISVNGTKVVILGGNDTKTIEAVEYFINNMLNGNELIIDSSCNMLCHPQSNLKPVSIMGKDISEYEISCPMQYREIANIVANEIGNRNGAIIKVKGERPEIESENEIIIGSVKRGVIGSWNYDGYSIRAENGKIYIGGQSEYSIGSACRKLLDIMWESDGNIPEDKLNISYVLPEREEYINDISKLAMHWDIYMETPDWMLDFEEKVRSMNNPSGRLMSCIHRGDSTYYPENSIEGIISAVRMGGDMIETDLRKTSDGVIVLMHDETLDRMTNFSELRGKNGLPMSNKLCDWTYEQLQKLNLKSGNGRNGAKLTPYKIPTFEEALKVCAERIFLRLDKLDQWDYEKDIWPLIEKYGAYTTIIFTWHSAFTQNNYALTKHYKAIMKEKTGRSSFCFVGAHHNSEPKSVLATVRFNNLDNCIRLTDCNFSDTDFDTFLDESKKFMDTVRGQARVYIDANSNYAKHETPGCWKQLNDMGINILLVDHGFDLCKYISTNFSAETK